MISYKILDVAVGTDPIKIESELNKNAIDGYRVISCIKYQIYKDHIYIDVKRQETFIQYLLEKDSKKNAS